MKNQDASLPEVGEWVKEKHERLRYYVEICSKVREKFLNGPAKTATYVDLFCGKPKVKIRDKEEWVESGAVVAWKASQKAGTPFSEIFIADKDDNHRESTAKTLRDLGATVTELSGDAINAVNGYKEQYNNRSQSFKSGLHFAFLDPFGLANLHFDIIKALATCKRMDILVHISIIALQRNLPEFLEPKNKTLNQFIPGWRDELTLSGGDIKGRAQIFDYWKKQVGTLGFEDKHIKTKEIRGDQNQRLYWLALIAKQGLANVFWKEVLRQTDPQGNLF